MCYIMVLNGVILNAGQAYGVGMSVSGSFFATALSSGIFTFVMGVVANAPIALAPGMGLNGVSRKTPARP
jgi:AGZA family xanthine/uracil permease-like MFS transporter